MAYQERGADVCAIVHVYYAELFGEIVQHLQRCPTLRLVLITLVNPSVRAQLEVDARPLTDAGVRVDWVQVENRGRDMLPFVTVAPAALSSGCEVFLKLHTKRSPHLGPHGDDWRRELLDGLLPGPAIAERASRLFADHPNIAYGVPRSRIGTWAHRGRNHRKVRRLARRAGLRTPWRIVFPAGGMYWCNRGWIETVVSLGLTPADFEPESGQLDGTTAHALERLIGCYAFTHRSALWLPEPSVGQSLTV